MRSLRSLGLVVAVVAAVLTAEAFAVTNVAYRLQAGGQNKAADWKAGTKQLFVPGNEADGQDIYKGELMTWSVVAEVTGDTYGGANLVFSVELYRNTVDPLNLETGAMFRSTINDGTGTDPNASAAFAVSYNIAGNYGRLIDKRSAGGPRLEPIFTYPTAEPGKLIGMGAGYKEWKRAGGDNNLITSPGVGMATMVNGAPGLGIVPVAEGQIDMSTLPDGVYVLRVVPGTGNNVLRGDLAMAQTVDRPAFAVAASGATGDELSFNLTNTIPCQQGIVARHIFYNQSAWDGNSAAANAADDTAIATDKEALLPGSVGAFKNYISYNRGINGLMVDFCGLPQAPVVGQDVYFFVGNDGNLANWIDLGVQPTVSVRPGAGVNGSDRVTFIFPNNAVPNSKWLMIYFLSDANGGTLGLSADDFSYYGLAIGDSGNNAAHTQVDATDINGAKNNQKVLQSAPIDDRFDYNRDKNVNATDQNISKNNATNFTTRLNLIVAP